MLRAVIDTNTWISGLVWSGPPRKVIELVLGRELICSTSHALMLELERLMQYPRIQKVLGQQGLTAAELASQIGLKATSCLSRK